MPTYDYICTECEAEAQIFHGMSEEPPETCREMLERAKAANASEHRCEGAVERQVTGGTGLIFKGSGFYITDYKGKNAGAAPSGAVNDSNNGKASETAAKGESAESSPATSEKSSTSEPVKSESVPAGSA